MKGAKKLNKKTPIGQLDGTFQVLTWNFNRLKMKPKGRLIIEN